MKHIRVISTMFIFLGLLAMSVMLVNPARATGVLFVKPGGTGDCSSWANACQLQTALTTAVSGDQVWVAVGTYMPGGLRSDTFTLNSNIEVYGGFDGVDDANLGDRQLNPSLTVLSGDVGGNDNGVISHDEPTRSENSCHVVTVSLNSIGVKLDGFTITGGNADAYCPDTAGGGMNIYEGTQNLVNLIFTANTGLEGGGMHIAYGDPSITGVTFSNNSARDYGGGMSNHVAGPILNMVTFSNNHSEFGGGGMHAGTNSTPRLNNVTFDNNTAGNRGGGINVVGNSISLFTNVTFSGNSAANGGGLYSDNGSNFQMRNSTFSGNWAVNGGGMYNLNIISPAITNVTFSGNSADTGGAMYNLGVDNNPIIRNSIFWGNISGGGEQIYNIESTPAITDSVVEGGCPAGSTCTNMIESSPLLGVLQNNGGFTNTMALEPGSSAIDAGNDTACAAEFVSPDFGAGGLDQRDVSRPQGAHCDIGAFEVEGYTLAVTSTHGTVTKDPDQATYLPGDTVELTAAPDAHWSFSSWTGDLASSANPDSVTIHGDTSVTANYTQNEYTLTVTSAHGTVAKDPDQLTYHDGDVVQLTATADVHWGFADWTGDLASSANPDSVTIHGDTSVTANYTQNEYTLTVTSAHGTVAKEPDQLTYHDGDVVQLTATADVHWGFADWTGDLASSANPDSVTIHGDTSVTANYTQNEYTLTVTSAHGTVAKDPDQLTYHDGDVVQLTATADIHWGFADWTGDLASSANPDSVTIHGNTSVTANYVFQNQAPTEINLSGTSVAENQPVGTLVGTLTATDPDPGDTHTYSFACSTLGADDASFLINGSNLQTSAVFDYETKNSYTICIRTDDGNGGTYDENFSISVTNVLEILTATLRSISTQDGWMLESGEITNKGGSMNSTLTTLRLGDDAAKKQYRSLLSFATGAALPDNAVITRVTLKVKRQGVVGVGDPVTIFQGFILDIRKGTFGTAPLQITDWQALAQKTIGPAKPPLVVGWYTFNLTGLSANINKLATLSGVTQIRLRFKLDDNNNLLANYLSLYSGNAPLAYRPKLIIEYYIP